LAVDDRRDVTAVARLDRGHREHVRAGLQRGVHRGHRDAKRGTFFDSRSRCCSRALETHPCAPLFALHVADLIPRAVFRPVALLSFDRSNVSILNNNKAASAYTAIYDSIDDALLTPRTRAVK